MIWRDIANLIKDKISPIIWENLGIELLYIFLALSFFVFLVFVVSFFYSQLTISLFFRKKDKKVFFLLSFFIFLSLGLTIILSGVRQIELFDSTELSWISLILYLAVVSLFISLIIQEIGRNFKLGDSSVLYKTIIAFLLTLLIFSPMPSLYEMKFEEIIRAIIALGVVMGILIYTKLTNKICKYSWKFTCFLLSKEKKIMNKKGYIDPRIIFWAIIILLIIYIINRYGIKL